MDDLRLASQLRAIDEEPVAIDRAFLDALYEELLDIGFTPGQRPPTAAPGVGRSTPGRAVPRRRTRRWPPALLVAALLIGGSVGVAAGVGGFILGDAPADVAPTFCELITTAEIGAIVGAPVTVDSLPDSGWSGTGRTTRFCAYLYPPAPGTPRGRNLEISITRYADPLGARALVQPGTTGIAVAGIGDAAVLFPKTASVTTNTLLVLRGPDVISVEYLVDGGAVNPTNAQLEDIARLILARL